MVSLMRNTKFRAPPAALPGRVFIGEKSSNEAAAELYDAIAKELPKNQQ